MRYDKLCVTTDFSHGAACAIPYAVHLAKHFGGKIWLVHVFDGHYLYDANHDTPEDEFPHPEHWLDPLGPKLERRLNALAFQYTASASVEFTPVFLKGHAVNSTIQFLTAENIDCLVISTHGRTGFRHVIFGAVAERLIRQSPCPVLTVRPLPLP